MKTSNSMPGNPKPLGWLTKFLWRSYRPVTAFTVGQALSVFQCEHKEFPIMLKPLMGDGEILRIGAKTAGDIEKFIRISEDDSEALVGDGIKISRQGARFGFHNGWSMRTCYLNESEANLLAEVILEIFNNQRVGTVE